jgi:hypothetical protein
MTLLWHAVPKALDDFARGLARLMQGTELVEDWKACGANVDH